VTGISLDSNEEGLHDFLTSLDIVFSSAKFIYSKRNDCQVAKIVVDENQSEIVEDSYTWPEGIYCRPWLNFNDYKARQEYYKTK
jgi:hypothetical protein